MKPNALPEKVIAPVSFFTLLIFQSTCLKLTQYISCNHLEVNTANISLTLIVYRIRDQIHSNKYAHKWHDYLILIWKHNYHLLMEDKNSFSDNLLYPIYEMVSLYKIIIMLKNKIVISLIKLQKKMRPLHTIAH